jgi:multiple sugar transport system ATP-binding protein
MAQVLLTKISKHYGDVVAVRDVDLQIADGEFLVLVGPSGCGKSTCLRMIAGLEEITAGEIAIGDRVVNDVPPQDRDIAMVFQNYALYPHMSVYDNLAFGLRLKREPSGKAFPRTKRVYTEADIRTRVNAAAQMLGLGDYLMRRPRQLSGGQRQRVALGRAIVREPQVFLMDEPLSNLDAKLRVQTRAELILLHERLRDAGKSNTMVYVTHDQTEAMTMGDRIAVMRDGLLLQVDTPLNLYRAPASRFVAEFIGSPQMNVFGPLDVEAHNGTVELLGPPAEGRWRLRLPAEKADRWRERGAKGQVLFGIRPEHIADANSARHSAEGAAVPVNVEVREPLGSTVQLTLTAPGGVGLTAVVDADSALWRESAFQAVLDMDKCHAFDPATDEAIF